MMLEQEKLKEEIDQMREEVANFVAGSQAREREASTAGWRGGGKVGKGETESAAKVGGRRKCAAGDASKNDRTAGRN